MWKQASQHKPLENLGKSRWKIANNWSKSLSNIVEKSLFALPKVERLRVGHGHFFKTQSNPTQDFWTQPNPTQPNPQKSSPTQPNPSSTLGMALLGYTENFDFRSTRKSEQFDYK